MPLNYSKWDNLEVSDDSDIEGHPNVDHKSLVRWRQRDIHEKREARKHKIALLEANINCDNVLLPRITEISETLTAAPESIIAKSFPSVSAYWNSLVEKLEKQPSKACPPGNDPTKIEQTYDGMMLSLLKGVTTAVNQRVLAAAKDGESEEEKGRRVEEELEKEMKLHVKRLKESIEEKKKELETEIQESKKKITSDDIHEGFDSKYVPPKPAPEPVPAIQTKPKKKMTETTFEVLNPGVATTSAPAEVDTDDEEETELPQLTPALEGFSKIPVGQYDKSWEYIQNHRDVYVPNASDALLVAAFTAEGDGKKKYAKQCVHQSLLLQYCEKLGRDGPRVFFQKMMAGDKRAEKVFVDDFEKTYKHLANRVEITKAEAAQSQGKEQIQLVAEDPSTTINFNVPDGPPPEDLRLEGAGVEDLDIEEVRRALQLRWDVFQGFPETFQEALKTGELEAVNQVLGDMDVAEAESVVQRLDMAGILSFSEKGIRDDTGRK